MFGSLGGPRIWFWVEGFFFLLVVRMVLGVGGAFIFFVVVFFLLSFLSPRLHSYSLVTVVCATRFVLVGLGFSASLV